MTNSGGTLSISIDNDVTKLLDVCRSLNCVNLVST
jgi:hypothetical protein